jgi:Mrp family chromosome partitioning ATPase
LGSSKRAIGGLALLVGLLAGIGIALVSEQLDTRIRSDLDLDGLTDVPVLAELPLQRRAKSGATSISFIDRPDSAVSESFRELRTSIRAATGGRRGVCIMITSPAPGDGKTFVTANLAAAEATTGRQVAVVSADLHDRRIEVVLGYSEVAPIGLSHLSWLPQNGHPEQQRDHGGVHAEAQTAQRAIPVVQVERLADAPLRTSLAPKQEPLSEDREMGTRQGQGDLSGNLVRTVVPGLSLLPVGDNLSDLREVFANNRIDALIEELKLTFDLVLFDTPAVMSAPDAAILSRAADGVVVVVSAGRTRRGVVERALERLHSIQAPLLGVALNRVTSSTSATYHPLRRSPKQLRRDERHRTLGSHSRALSST